MASNSARAKAWVAAVLPQVEGLSEFRLRLAGPLSRHLEARYMAQLCGLFDKRLPIVNGAGSDQNVFVDHGDELRPINLAAGQRVTRFHGHPPAPVLLM